MKKPPTYVPLEKATKIDGGDEYKETAKKASENFQKLNNEEKYQDLFELIDDKSQLKSDAIYWDRRLHNIKNDLGKLEKSEFKRANVFQKSKTVEVRIEYLSKFDKDNSSDQRYEIFFWEIYQNGEVKLLNYLNFIDNQPQY
jgi:hypothetical protein